MAGQDEVERQARAMTLALLTARKPGATLCPSEVARVLATAAGTAWRDEMPTVHAAIDCMVAEELIRLSWKGTAMEVREGPYRIARGEG